jgi:hypothetical protein
VFTAAKAAEACTSKAQEERPTDVSNKKKTRSREEKSINDKNVKAAHEKNNGAAEADAQIEKDGQSPFNLGSAHRKKHRVASKRGNGGSSDMQDAARVLVCLSQGAPSSSAKVQGAAIVDGSCRELGEKTKKKNREKKQMKELLKQGGAGGSALRKAGGGGGDGQPDIEKAADIKKVAKKRGRETKKSHARIGVEPVAEMLRTGKEDCCVVVLKGKQQQWNGLTQDDAQKVHDVQSDTLAKEAEPAPSEATLEVERGQKIEVLEAQVQEGHARQTEGGRKRKRRREGGDRHTKQQNRKERATDNGPGQGLVCHPCAAAASEHDAESGVGILRFSEGPCSKTAQRKDKCMASDDTAAVLSRTVCKVVEEEPSPVTVTRAERVKTHAGCVGTHAPAQAANVAASRAMSGKRGKKRQHTAAQSEEEGRQEAVQCENRASRKRGLIAQEGVSYMALDSCALALSRVPALEQIREQTCSPYPESWSRLSCLILVSCFVDATPCAHPHLQECDADVARRRCTAGSQGRALLSCRGQDHPLGGERIRCNARPLHDRLGVARQPDRGQALSLTKQEGRLHEAGTLCHPAPSSSGVTL